MLKSAIILENQSDNCETIFHNKNTIGSSSKIKKATHIPKLDCVFLLLTDSQLKQSIFIKQSLFPQKEVDLILAESAEYRVDSFEVNEKFPKSIFFSKKNFIFCLKLRPIISLDLESLQKSIGDINHLVNSLDQIQNILEIKIEPFAKKYLHSFQIDLEFVKNFAPHQKIVLKFLFEIEGLKMIKKRLEMEEWNQNKKFLIFPCNDQIDQIVRDQNLKLSTFDLEEDWQNQTLKYEFLLKFLVLCMFLKLDEFTQKIEGELVKMLLEKHLPEMRFIWDQKAENNIEKNTFQSTLSQYFSFKEKEFIIFSELFSESKLSDTKEEIIIKMQNQLQADKINEINENTDVHNLLFLNKASKLNGLTETKKMTLFQMLLYTHERKSQDTSYKKVEKLEKIFSSHEPQINFFKFDTSFSNFFANSSKIIGKYSLSQKLIKRVQKYSTQKKTVRIWIHPYSPHLIW